ncbi:MAG: hypothetical protein KKD77_20810 [Gammaproteobacteria bacterium]|nr:hypothetical protein [Gammaproteobacteria bacterium]MBU2685813.1 hypothetical protein [Gammaproteobacteria bacterium]
MLTQEQQIKLSQKVVEEFKNDVEFLVNVNNRLHENKDVGTQIVSILAIITFFIAEERLIIKKRIEFND